MERCKCLPLNSKFARKSVLIKTKPFNRQTVISVNQLFKVLSTSTNTHMPSTLAATDQWPCRWRFAWTQPKTTLSFCFLRGSVATLFAWSWKILSYFGANLSKTLRNNFYQNRSSIVEVMIKIFFGVFMPHSVYRQCRERSSTPNTSVRDLNVSRICMRLKILHLLIATRPP